jgi:hypothetical protein
VAESETQQMGASYHFVRDPEKYAVEKEREKSAKERYEAKNTSKPAPAPTPAADAIDLDALFTDDISLPIEPADIKAAIREDSTPAAQTQRTTNLAASLPSPQEATPQWIAKKTADWDSEIATAKKDHSDQFDDTFFGAVADAATFQLDKLYERYGVAGALPIATAAALGGIAGGGAMIAVTGPALAMLTAVQGNMVGPNVITGAAAVGAGILAAPVVAIVHIAKKVLGLTSTRIDTHSEDACCDHDTALAAIQFADALKMQCFQNLKARGRL